MAYDYEKSVDFRGNADEVLERMRERLIARNFMVSSATANQLQFANALPYPLIKKDHLYVVSNICVTAAQETLTLRADLRYLHETGKFISVFLTVAVLPVMAFMFGVIAWTEKRPELLFLSVPVMAVPVLLLFSLQKLQRRYVLRALDALLSEVAAGESETGRFPGEKGKNHGV